MVSEFQPYLKSIRADGEQRSRFYTSTDVEIELMVERIEEKPQDRNGDREQKIIERLPVLKGLHKYASEHVLLVGRPGSGKSTALEQLLLEAAQQAEADQTLPIPVLVQLRADRPILSLIRDKLRKHGLRKTEDQIDELLFEGKLLLLLDGINEIPKSELRQALQEFRDNNRNVPMVFTTRDLELGGALGIEKKLRMQPLTAKQLKQFVGTYLPEQGAEFLGRLNDRLKELAQTPLLLKMLCDVFRFEGELPRSRGGLFRTFDQKYEEIKGALPVSADFRRFKSELLQHLAFGMLEGNALEPRLRLVRAEAEQRLEALLNGRVSAPGQAAKEWLEDLLEHHLLQVADDPRQIEFHHQLFLEYYAAEALLNRVDRLEDERLKREFLNFLKWTEPVAMMLALVDEAQAERVIRLALQVDWRVGSRFAGAVKPEFQKKTVGFVEELRVPDWLKVECLGETRSESAIPELLERLKRANSKVRRRTAEALGKIGSESAIPELLERLEHGNCDVRRTAAEALGKIGSESAIPGLLERLEDTNSLVRRKAAKALGKIRSESAIAGLLEQLEHADADALPRTSAALGKIRSETAVSRLLERLEHADADIRGNAAYALGKIRSETAIPGLLERLKHADADVRESAAYALGEIGSEAAISGLLERLEDANSLVRRTATVALGRIGSEAAIPGLLERLEDANSLVRRKAAYALGKIGSEAAISRLLERLEHADADVRESISYALGRTIGKHVETIAQHLPHLLALIPTNSGQDVDRVILATQRNCKYYNYEVFQAYLEAQKAEQTPSNNDRPTIYAQKVQIFEQVKTYIENNSTERLIMTDKAPIFNQQNATIGVNYTAQGSKQDFTQYINAPEQNFEILLTGYKQFIDELHQAHPSLTNEAEIIKTIDIEARRIDARWQNFLNLKRLWNGSKKAAVKVGEHFVESNPWGKGAIAFLEGVSEDVK